MDFKDWLRRASPEERVSVAEAADTTADYFKQIAGKHRKPSPGLAKRIVRASVEITPDRIIDIGSLRPDLWGATAA